MYRMLIAIFCSLFYLSGFAQNPRPIDVQHYSFHIELRDAHDTISGFAEIELKALVPLRNFSLDLKNSMQVLQVSSTTGPVSYSHENDVINVSFPQVVDSGEKFVLGILYKGVPADGLIISKNKFGDRTFFADNWPNRAHHWIPVNDHPADKASFEFRVTAPSHYQVISNGERVALKEERFDKTVTHWKEEIPLSTKIMVIGAAPFAVKTYEDSPRGIPVSAWVYPQDSTHGFYDYAVAPGMVRFFADYIGPFPFSKLANVQSTTIFGGMENASAIFYDEKAINGKRGSEGTVAHEIVHQWFGDMASEKSFAHLWLSEGFATYLTHIFYEKNYGSKIFRNRLVADRQRVVAFANKSDKPVVDTTSDLMSLLNANSYQKGGWVLHMLRQEVGDDIFQEIIRTYYRQYNGSNADTRDFQAVAEKVSGKQLQWFFDQWLYRPGVPKLQIKWRVDGNNVNIMIHQLINTIYRLPLDLQITTADGRSTIHQVFISDKDTTLYIETSAKPVKLIADPNVRLLFEEVR